MTATPLWASVSDLPTDLVTKVGADKAEDALEYASHVLWSLTGRKYGPETVVTEAYETGQSLARGAQVYPVFMNGRPYNVSDCSSCRCSGCGVFHRTRLRGQPVNYIVDVWVNGCVLPRSAYALLDHSVLGLMDSRACGASCITVRYSTNGLPPGGRLAAATLAAQLLFSDTGSTECRLPQRVTSVSRQGMSWTLLDPQDFLDKGRTGIYEIDLLLRALNPSGALAPARVFSPDLPRATAFSYTEPPLSVLLADTDQIVIAGKPMRFTSTAPRLMQVVLNDDETVTRLAGMRFDGAWYVLDPSDSGGALLDLTADETLVVRDGDVYTVENASGEILLSGKVRVL